MITIATSRDNAAVRTVECLLCGGLELDQQAPRIPSVFLFISSLVSCDTVLLLCVENEQLPSFYNTNTHGDLLLPNA